MRVLLRTRVQRFLSTPVVGSLTRALPRASPATQWAPRARQKRVARRRTRKSRWVAVAAAAQPPCRCQTWRLRDAACASRAARAQVGLRKPRNKKPVAVVLPGTEERRVSPAVCSSAFASAAPATLTGGSRTWPRSTPWESEETLPRNYKALGLAADPNGAFGRVNPVRRPEDAEPVRRAWHTWRSRCRLKRVTRVVLAGVTAVAGRADAWRACNVRRGAHAYRAWSAPSERAAAAQALDRNTNGALNGREAWHP